MAQTKEDIAALIMSAFRARNSKPKHSLELRWIQRELLDKLNPKEQELVNPAIGLLVEQDSVTWDADRGIILLQKGYEEIYPIVPATVIEKIGSAIMTRFAETKSKVNHTVDIRWLSQVLLPKLNPREREYIDAAIEDLVENKKYVSTEDRHGFCLVLLQLGYDQLY